MDKFKLLIIFLFILFLLIIRFYGFYQNQPQFIDGQEVSFETTLLEEPEEKGSAQKFRIITDMGVRIYVISSLSPHLSYGDTIKIDGKLSKKEYTDFTYLSLNFPNIQIIETEQFFLTRLASVIRGQSKRFFEGNLTPNGAGLLNGIVFGARGGLQDDYMENLRDTGVLHVIAASGMNVTFIAAWFMVIFGRIMKRQIALIVTILGVLFYAFLAGFDASIVRASVMAIIAFSAGFFGRQNLGILALFVTGFIMLFVSPFYFFDVGFQLSFLSTLGILIIKPFFDRFIDKISLVRVVGDDVGTTISAQIMALPILLGTFGNYGILSVVVNALVLWTVPFLMVIGAISILVSFVFEPFARLILLISHPILLYFEYVVRFFGDLGLVLNTETTSVFVWIGYYLILVAGIYAISLIKNDKKKNR